MRSHPIVEVGGATGLCTLVSCWYQVMLDMKTQTVYMGARVLPKIKEAVEKLVPDRWATTAQFVQEAIVEKLRKENIPVP